MMKATKLAVILVAAGLSVGCASKGDITNLQTQIDGLKAEVTSVKSTADEALSAAQAAESKAAAAEATSRRTATEVETKLNAGFKKHMLK
ncbi:MAG: Lpp/OprI family alanine-zipper lipoprotein [Methylococcaceae bacterium]|nr:Lpp/OprI family alanine-zipper lipoprotein [Methylococcaceae bacterium]